MNSRIFFRSKAGCVMIAFSVVFLLVGGAYAGTQNITLSPDSVVALSNETLSFNIVYDVEGVRKKTTGIGIRIHFNSKIVDEISLSDVYGEGMVGQDYIPQSDTNNLDDDATTDKYIVIAWAGISGKWPTFVALPGPLATLNVKIKQDAPAVETKLNITSSGAASGYAFSGKSAHLLVQ